MKHFVLVSALGVLSLTSCEKKAEIAAPFCDIVIKSITGAAQGVASALGCEGVPAIAAMLSKPVTDLAMCSGSSAQGVVGDLVCPSVASFVIGLGTDNLPADWKCKGGPVGATAQALILDACKKAVIF